MNERLLAIGDIHGCMDPFRELVEKNIRIRRSDRIILLGDYIDRGYKSREVVDYIIDLQNQGFDIIPLMGNHESMLIDSLGSEQSMYNWSMNGGSETLLSFGIKTSDEMDLRYLQFFKNLAFYYVQDRFIFVHAGFNNDIADPFQDKSQMMWSRRESYSNPAFSGKVIVHGHTPVPFALCSEMVLSRNNVINIDTGCVYNKAGGYGHLTAIELFTRELFSV